MSENADVLFEAVSKLPEDERLALASRILDTIPSDRLAVSLDDPHLANELERRFADTAGAIPWAELRAEG